MNMSIDSFTNATAREAPNVASDAPTDAIDVEIKQDSPIETKVEPPAMAMANHAPDETVEDDPMAASSSAQRHTKAVQETRARGNRLMMNIVGTLNAFNRDAERDVSKYASREAVRERVEGELAKERAEAERLLLAEKEAKALKNSQLKVKRERMVLKRKAFAEDEAIIRAASCFKTKAEPTILYLPNILDEAERSVIEQQKREATKVLELRRAERDRTSPDTTPEEDPMDKIQPDTANAGLASTTALEEVDTRQEEEEMQT